MQVREFNEKGISAFREWLEACRQDPQLPLCSHLLQDTALSTAISPECHAPDAEFESKHDAAVHLHQLLAAIPESRIVSNAGLWTWLSLRYFDQICPRTDSGWTVKNDYFYVFAPTNARHFYRHLLFISWQILRIAPAYNRLLLQTPVSSLDAITDQVMKRLYLTRIPCIFEVLHKLYWDADRQAPRKGITSNKIRQGDLRHRFPIRIQQLEKTFDLQTVSATQLISLLGREFAVAETDSQGRL